MERYKKYKDCGVEWIGEIPSGWETLYPKKLFFQRNERARYNDVQLTCSQKHGVISQKWFTELEDYRPVSVTKGEEILKHVSVGDFVISMRSFQGGLEYSEVEGKISSAYVMITPRSDSVYPAYYKYLFKSKRYIEALRSTSNLVRDGQAMRFSNFVQVTLPLPPKEEQRAISAFLELKISQIDSLIEETQNTIKLLEEYRKAVISEAVTKGLDPNVPMKDSGIKWAGEIPEEWKVVRIAHVVRFHSGEALDSSEMSSFGDYPVYGGGNIKGYTSEYNYSGGTVVVSRQGATCGTTRYLENKIWVTEHGLIGEWTTVKHNKKWLAYILNSMNLDHLSMTSAQPGISAGLIENQYFMLPPTHQQVEIADYLDDKTAGIDSLIYMKRLFTKRLNEYKNSLVSECVTGKVKVSGVDES